MNFEDLELAPARLITTEPFVDGRGSFARLYCVREFQNAGLSEPIVQTSLSRTARRGTVRGMHFQLPPSREAKLVRCIRGAVLDVIVDIRPDSERYLQQYQLELSEGAHNALLVPSGFAHGFQSLEDDVMVLYQMTDYFEPDLARGIRWDDPALGIEWPLPVSSISERDASYDNHEERAVVAFNR